MSEEPVTPHTTTAAAPDAQWHYDPQGDPSSTFIPANSEANFTGGPAPAQAAPEPDEDVNITWTASEFIAYHKSARWFGTVVAVTIVASLAIFFLTHDKVSAAFLVILGILFCVAATRKPRILRYTIDHNGIQAGDRFHPYTDFVSFAVYREGAFANIELLPSKRLMPPTSIFCSPDNEEEVLEALSEFVPYHQYERTLFDRLMNQIHL